MQSEGHVNKVTVATHGDRIPLSGPCASGDHHHVWILAPDGKNALGPGLTRSIWQLHCLNHDAHQ
jgi:hypothetical protein